MITILQHTVRAFRASRILPLCIIIHALYAETSEPHSAKIAIAQSWNTHFAQFTNADFRGGPAPGADSIRRDLRNIQAQADHAEVRDVRFDTSPRTMVCRKAMLLPFCRIVRASCGLPLETGLIAMTVCLHRI